VSLAAKQKSHRPGRPLAHGLRAGEPSPIFYRGPTVHNPPSGEEMNALWQAAKSVK
jgi:hypothetical protein